MRTENKSFLTNCLNSVWLYTKYDESFSTLRDKLLTLLLSWFAAADFKFSTDPLSFVEPYYMLRELPHVPIVVQYFFFFFFFKEGKGKKNSVLSLIPRRLVPKRSVFQYFLYHKFYYSIDLTKETACAFQTCIDCALCSRNQGGNMYGILGTPSWH